MRRQVERTVTVTEITCDVCGQIDRSMFSGPCVMCDRDVCESDDCAHVDVVMLDGGSTPYRYCCACWATGVPFRERVAVVKSGREHVIAAIEGEWKAECERRVWP